MLLELLDDMARVCQWGDCRISPRVPLYDGLSLDEFCPREREMSAVGACRIPILSAVVWLSMACTGCTAKQPREVSEPTPVAAPTSTVSPDGAQTPEAGQPSSSAADVPFDGARPEALGTALPAHAARETAVPASPTPDLRRPADGLATGYFDVYATLLGGSLVCTGEQQ